MKLHSFELGHPSAAGLFCDAVVCYTLIKANTKGGIH